MSTKSLEERGCRWKTLELNLFAKAEKREGEGDTLGVRSGLSTSSSRLRLFRSGLRISHRVLG